MREIGGNIFVKNTGKDLGYLEVMLTFYPFRA